MANNNSVIPEHGQESVNLEGMMSHVQAVMQRFNSEVVTPGLAGKAADAVMGASGSNHKKGLVPDPGATAGSSKFLREDCTWQTPPNDNTTYKLTIGSMTKGDSAHGTDLGTLKSETAASGGATLSLVTTGEKYTWNGKQDKITDLAAIGNGTGVCTTPASTAAKEVAITNFLLLKNGIISVRFTAGIQVAAATLNVNSQGAKPIYINGQPVQPGDIRAGQTAMMAYDGSHWNISSIVGTESGGSAQDLYVDMGLPSGLLWAKKNIDATQADGFAASEYQYECSFFSFGNVEPHNPTSNSSFAPYSFGSSNDEEPYKSSAGAKIGYPGSAGPSHDAARTILGGPWREPATEDFAELFNSSYTKYIDADGNDIAADVTNKSITMNSIVGIRLKSKVNGNIIFFPCSGFGSGSSWHIRGARGLYWSRSLYSAAHGRDLNFYSGGVSPQNHYGRFNGFPVRPVQ